MLQFADGGVMASRPYVASGQCIQRMSDYCVGCRFDPAQRTGPKACLVTPLYWDFFLRRGIMVTDTTLEGPKSPRIIYVNAAWLKMTGYGRDEIANQTPRMLQGKHTDRAVVGSLKQKLLNREVFHGQTWNCRKSGEPFLMNWSTNQRRRMRGPGLLDCIRYEKHKQHSRTLPLLRHGAGDGAQLPEKLSDDVLIERGGRR